MKHTIHPSFLEIIPGNRLRCKHGLWTKRLGTKGSGCSPVERYYACTLAANGEPRLQRKHDRLRICPCDNDTVCGLFERQLPPNR